VSHQWPQPDDTPAQHGLLPGRYAGGAEFLQDMMRSKAPDGVELVLVDVTDETFEDVLAGCDRVVVGATERLPGSRVGWLAGRRPVCWLMSPQQPRMAGLLERSMVLWASVLLREATGFGPEGEVCPGWWDTSVVPRGVAKEPFVLWVGRDEPWKGREAARSWAEGEGREFVALTNVPRVTVLEHMGRAATFVHLPSIVDPCPTTVIEAEIAGCDIVVNSLVGRTPVRGVQANVEYIEGCADRFWGVVCG
jgi:hypothetical protein